MDDTKFTGDSSVSRPIVRLAALAAVAFYVLTAHLTKGHEADFGKQWLAARLVVTGNGRDLFNLDAQRAELERQYSSEVIDRGIWRDGIGGPTYPPTLAVLFAPLGCLSPAAAQWVLVQFSVLLVVVSGRLVSRLTAGRVSPEAATLATMVLPCFFLTIGVGQNSAISLAVFVGGLVLFTERRDFLAGVVWGLFAIKPTWGIAVAWVPAVIARPRAYLGMAATGLALIALTLPVCGVQSWLDWLAVARQTERYYQLLPRWAALSRDLPGLLRRIAHGRWVELVGWSVVALVIAATAKTWWTRRPTRKADPTEWISPRGVTLLAAAVLSCPRFMFYDMTLAVVPFLVAFAGWSELRGGARWVLAGLSGMLWIGTAFSYVSSAMLGIPLDTLALLLLWLWSIAVVHGETGIVFRVHPLSVLGTTKSTTPN